MDAAREKELVELLTKYDVGGVPLAKAKTEILAKGYTEAEIVYALYSAPYDGKDNTVRPENPLRKFYEEKPQEADRLAKSLVRDIALTEATNDLYKMGAYTAASEFAPGPHARAYYGYKAAETADVPYFPILLIILSFVILSYLFNFPVSITQSILFVASLFVSAWFIFALVKKYLRIRKLRKESHEQK